MVSPNKVDEEYLNALRTKSYTDLYAKVHESDSHKLHHSHSSPIPYRCRIPEFLLQPSQESLVAAANSGGSIKALLLDFFDATLGACIACSSLLRSINRARSHHRAVRRLLLLLTLSSSESLYAQLSSHLELDNPLSLRSLANFHATHARYPPLVRELTAGRCRITCRERIVRFARAACGMAAAEAMFGAMAVERAKARVEVAARGAYIVGRDLDTVSRMVRRAHDGVEHGRDVARMAVRNRGWEMAREVVREMEVGMGVEEKLRELEEHVYLCLIAINRSRRSVAREMVAVPMKTEPPPPPPVIVLL